MSYQVLVIGKRRCSFEFNGQSCRAVKLYIAYEPRFSVGFSNEVEGLCLGAVYVALDLWSKISIGNCYLLSEGDGNYYKNALCLDYSDINQPFKDYLADFASGCFS